MAKLVNVKSGLGYGIRLHTNNKMPKYIPEAITRKVVVDKAETQFYLRPNKPDSDRVNLKLDGIWCYIDSPTLHHQVDKAKDGALEFRIKDPAPEAVEAAAEATK
jgi:hypothetical protein